eukprot:gnl/TRDRNA2_/TRDRNA2_84364_c0_seq1.p1 gnl/TRDRNA2_/TRDRNA2_84364_c0~~gnl/TRDRNA2_/TRDRNA2_84364_c0_seq1.p1  ORF type:complete len:200 (-),score=32.63 gnl/TRDRNA2_/TRDRNA2_84364_c0_seq1:116-715(-)
MVASRAVQGIDPVRIAKLSTFFARASVATRLLQSRLALPIAYPLNSASMSEDNKKRAQGWKEEEIKRGLAHVTPIVTGLAKVAPVLKAAHAMSHYRGGHLRHVRPHPKTEEAREQDFRLDFVRPQRIKGANFGRSTGGNIATKIGRGLGWEDVSSGRTVDSVLHRFTTNPLDDSPDLAAAMGRKYVSKTKWNKRKSGSQ